MLLVDLSKMDIKRRKQLRASGHSLHPLVTVAAKGLADTVIAEIQRALHDHELIKVKFQVADRSEKQALITQVCAVCDCALVQQIGHVALLYKANPEAKPNLSKAPRG
jgi:RNA-binding protein